MKGWSGHARVGWGVMQGWGSKDAAMKGWGGVGHEGVG